MRATKKISHHGNAIFRSPSGDRVARMCTRCKVLFPISNFYHPLPVCKSCDYNRPYRQKFKQSVSRRHYVYGLSQRSSVKMLRDQRRLRPDGQKKCSLCKELLTLDKFHMDKARPDGLRTECSNCFKTRWGK